MFFKAMLWAMAKRFEWLIEHNEAFRKEISGRICVMQFETRDRKVERYFAFAAGSMKSKPMRHENPSITFTFESSAAARKLVLNMAKDPEDMSGFLDALNAGKIRIKGDISLMVWFMTLSGHITPDAPDLKSVNSRLTSFR